MFSVTNPFHLLALAVQLGKEFERTAWYRAEEIKKKKTVQKTSYGQKQIEERLIGGRMQSG